MGSPRREFLSSLAALLGAAALDLGCDHSASPAPRASRRAPPAPGRGGAELLVVGGAIVTMDPATPRVEALACSGGQIIAVGRRADLEGLRGPATRVLDLEGGVATPGLTDAHAHLAGLGRHLEDVDLTGARSQAELIARVQAHAARHPGDGWITGRGWDQNLWPGGEMPTHHALSDALPGRAVWLRRVDGHAGLASRRALELAGVTRDTPDPPGGELLRDAAGEPTGVLVDAAMALVPTPAPTSAAIERWLLAGQARALSLGITGVHDMGVSREADQVYAALAGDGRLALRVHGYADDDWFFSDLVKETPKAIAAGDRYALVGVKLYVDGALGSRGAALLADYSDRPGHRGLLQREPAALAEQVARAVGRRWQVASHAIGDRGCRVLLDAYEAALKDLQGESPRLRVEHAQVLALADIPRLARLGVVASVQPTHATSDMPWAQARVGPERIAGAYAWRRLLAAGATLALGSDFPVERPDITHGLYAAITRQDPEGNPPGGWRPEERLTLDEAVAGFTAGAAYAAGREAHLGALTRGRQADLTCFVRDPWTLEPAALREAEIAATIVGGDVVWQRG
ncbi:MAG: amidohydrolase [Nannocystaceae bacterium]